MINSTNLCMVCKQGNDTSYYNKLNIIYHWLKNNTKTISADIDHNRVREIEQKVGAFQVFTHTEYCKYGIRGCNKLNSINNRHNQLAFTTRRLLIDYIYAENYSNVAELLRLLQGYYPKEYKILVEESCKKKKFDTKE